MPRIGGTIEASSIQGYYNTADTTVQLAGARSVEGPVRCIVLSSGAPTDENSLAEPVKADYLFTVKDNQPTLKQDIADLHLEAFPPSAHHAR